MIRRFVNSIIYYVENLEMNDYLLFAALAIMVGFLCLKGFGSRAYY